MFSRTRSIFKSRRRARLFFLLLAAVAVVWATSAYSKVYVVSHTPKPGQYGTIAAALAAAQPGDTIELVDNSAPFIESISVPSGLNFILIRGKDGLNPRPTIRGLASAPTVTPRGPGFTMENLILETQGASCVIESGASSDAYINCKIDATGAQTAIASDGPLQLTGCEVVGGVKSIQHVKGGPFKIQGCTIRGASGRGLEILGSGTYTIQDSTLSAKAGGVIYVKDENRATTEALKVYIKNNFIMAETTAYQDLITFDQGAASLIKMLEVNQCDLVGWRSYSITTGRGLVCVPTMNSISVKNTIFHNLAAGAYRIDQPGNLAGGFDLFCVYKNASYNLSNFGIASGIGSVELAGTDPLYVNPAQSDYRLQPASLAANRNVDGVPQWAGSKGIKATREVTHTPGAGQYASVAAALQEAVSGDVIEIIDNSAPFVENVSVAGKTNLVIQGKYGLNPAPVIQGAGGGAVMTHAASASGNYVRNLTLAAGASDIILDERATNPTYQNVTLDGQKTDGAQATFNILSQGPLSLDHCTIKNGRNSIEHNYGNLYASHCSFTGGAENGVCLLGSGNVTLNRCYLSAHSGAALLLVDANNSAGSSLNITLNYSHIASVTTGVTNLVVALDGAADVGIGLTADHCDFTGNGSADTAINATTKLNNLSITNSIFYKLNFGAFSFADATGLTGGVEDYCAYQQVSGGNNVAAFGIAAGSHSKLIQPYELFYTCPALSDLRLISESDYTFMSSTGGCPGSYGVDYRDVRQNDLTHEWEVGTNPVLWNFQNCYNSCVVYHPQDAAYPYKMWFFGNPSGPVSDMIYFARSASLTSGWQVYKGNGTYDTTMTPSTWVSVVPQNTASGAWDNATGDPSVVLKDGVFYMAFSAVRQDWSSGDLHTINSVMGATSTDGINWTRSSAPIIIWEDEVTNPIVGLDGNLPANSMGSYHRPSLIWTGSGWGCYFDYLRKISTEIAPMAAVGYAQAGSGNFLDPSNWQYLYRDDNELRVRWGNPEVTKVGDTYYSTANACWFWGLGGDSCKLGWAESVDGLNWTDLGMLQPNGRDCTDIPQFLLLDDPNGNGQWLYIFYAWRLESPYGDPPNYKEIRWMRKLIR